MNDITDTHKNEDPEVKERFAWTHFYMAMADKLLAFRNRREELIAGIHAIGSTVEHLAVLNDRFNDGSTGPLRDICPFTTFALFNRGLTDENRQKVAEQLARLLGVTEPVPKSFDGVPLVNNQNTWFFSFSTLRKPGDLSILWEVFARALAYADLDNGENRTAFARAYDKALTVRKVKWNLTFGLFWIRPWSYPTLDGASRKYIGETLHIPVVASSPKGCSSAGDYLAVRRSLFERFWESSSPVHSFPELSYAAWAPAESNIDNDEDGAAYRRAAPADYEVQTQDLEPDHVSHPEFYSIDSILSDGSFLTREKLEQILSRLRLKKNLILQGPPGTGKTWLARRLAYALMGIKDASRICAVQFHPNLSYEDFVRGWRPRSGSGLALVDGPFLQMAQKAQASPDMPHVVLIEEINRGTPAQIFGEMLTLLEADKREEGQALSLSYSRSDTERVYLPPNLYLIGTMNIADRSLALVDLALRRRFAFVTLEPVLDDLWQQWVQGHFAISADILAEIRKNLQEVNREIAEDPQLGPQFKLGHSFVTPPAGAQIADARAWFRDVVETEIGPLLNEYWYDVPQKAEEAKSRLLQGIAS